jgi:hypothetical protein
MGKYRQGLSKLENYRGQLAITYDMQNELLI